MLNKVLRELNSCGARQYELADGFENEEGVPRASMRKPATRAASHCGIVIPGRCKPSKPESRDSGLVPDAAPPGITAINNKGRQHVPAFIFNRCAAASCLACALLAERSLRSGKARDRHAIGRA